MGRYYTVVVVWLCYRNVLCSLDMENALWRWVFGEFTAFTAVCIYTWHFLSPSSRSLESLCSLGQIPLPYCSSQSSLHKEECNTIPALSIPQMIIFAAVANVPTAWLSVGRANWMWQFPQLPLPSLDGVDVPWHLPCWVKVVPFVRLRVASSCALELKRIFARKVYVAQLEFKIKV